MADPLTLLRQFNIQKKNIVEREDQVIFDTISFLKTAKTNYVIGRWVYICLLFSHFSSHSIAPTSHETLA